MQLVALTGGIASGKSAVAARLAAHGAVVVDADRIAREIVEPGTPALARIAEEFGPEYLTPEGALDRPRLGALIFADPAKRRLLNSITHPAVEERSHELFARAGAADPEAVVVYDVPLLADGGRAEEFDLVVVVAADEEERIRRMTRLRGMSREEAERRIASQASEAERLAIADVVIDANGTLEHTWAQADALWDDLRRRSDPGEAARRIWRSWFPEPSDDGPFALVIDPALPDDRRAMLLRTPDHSVATVTPAVAAGLGDPPPSTEHAFRTALGAAGLTLHEPDRVFLLADAAIAAEATAPGVRILGPADVDAFARFTAEAPERDLDDAYVELDHWAVVGAFDGDRLVAAASAYPWDGTLLADIGVLTLPDVRGRGLGRAVVRELCRVVLARGYAPQYRSQPGNAASLALADRAGFAPLGDWEVVEPDDESPADVGGGA